MDNYQKVLEMTRHPEKFSDKELDLLFSDDECRQLYNLLCETDSSIKSCHTPPLPDISEEWDRLAAIEKRKSLFSRLKISRAAVVAIVVTTSLIGLAVGIGINTGKGIDKKTEATAVSSSEKIASDEATKDSLVEVKAASPVQTSVLYENVPLGQILADLSSFYQLGLDISPRLNGLRLYFRWDKAATPDEIIRQLNNFEKINLKIAGGTITDK